VPPPTPATVYELTERGLALKPALLELSRWGRPLLREPDADHLPDSALLLGLEVAFRPEAAGDRRETYDFDVEGLQVAVRVHDGTVDIVPGSAGDDASATVVTDRQGFIELALGQAGESVRVEGDADALVRLRQMFSLA